MLKARAVEGQSFRNLLSPSDDDDPAADDTNEVLGIQRKDGVGVSGGPDFFLAQAIDDSFS
ncbi:MAG: hypothetical protein WKF28_01255 [Rubrobacteraceae bacterium]